MPPFHQSSLPTKYPMNFFYDNILMGDVHGLNSVFYGNKVPIFYDKQWNSVILSDIRTHHAWWIEKRTRQNKGGQISSNEQGISNVEGRGKGGSGTKDGWGVKNRSQLDFWATELTLIYLKREIRVITIFPMAPVVGAHAYQRLLRPNCP